MAPRTSSKAGKFLRENGWFLFLGKLLSMLGDRLRNTALRHTLGVSGLSIGPRSRITGVRHLSVGKNFSAARNLWLDAVTRYEGQTFDPMITIGDDCNLSEAVHIACTHRVTIGRGFLAGSHVIITDHSHGVYRGLTQSDPATTPRERQLSTEGSVWIGDNVWLGDGVAVLPGADIGDGCIVGANAVVNSRLPPRTISVGAPARPVREWDEGTQKWQPLRDI